VVPDNCVVTVDMRTVPGQDLPDFKASVKVTNDRSPVETSPEECVVQSIVDVIAEVTGERPVPRGTSYCTDGVALVPALKAPMIICGPGDPRLAHQPNEHVEVSTLVEAARIFTLAAIRLLQ
jgi:succinyl-diaminopimelate desuccinylase